MLRLYAFAGPTGLFAKQAIEMLREVFNVVFTKVEAKDAGSGATRPQQAATNAAAGPKPTAVKAGDEQKP